ncbi:unnamed protein product [Durusdinium trenchii]|uniref:Uncharacterized protein n=1 Tax=Durusdinium trenchii TaxID=1381693 RepID=A0ABP0I7T2_9DINO
MILHLAFAHLVAAQDSDCAADGALCCALKYGGEQNFFNQEQARCERVADDCTPTEEYDPQVNKCVTVSDALASFTNEPTTSTATTSSGHLCMECCGHGHPDPSDPTTCVCDDGWTSNAFRAEQCSVQVEQANSTGNTETSATHAPSIMMTLTSVWGFLLSNGGPALLLTVLVLCCCCCYCRASLKRAFCWCCCAACGRRSPNYAMQAPVAPPLWQPGVPHGMLPPPISAPLVMGARPSTTRMVGKGQPS